MPQLVPEEPTDKGFMHTAPTGLTPTNRPSHRSVCVWEGAWGTNRTDGGSRVVRRHLFSHSSCFHLQSSPATL